MFKLLRFQFVLYPTVAGRTTSLKPSVRHSNHSLSQRLSSEQSRLQTEERARRRRVPNNRWQVVVGARRCQVVLLPVHPPLTSRAGPTGGGASAAPRAHTHVRDITPQPHAGGNYARGKTLVRQFLSFCVRSNRSLSTVNMFFCRMDFGR